MNTYQTTGSLCPCLQDQSSLLDPQECLTTQRNMGGGDGPSRPARCPFPRHLHPPGGFDTSAAEAKAQPLLPIAARSRPSAGIPCSPASRRSPRCNAGAQQPALPRARGPRGGTQRGKAAGAGIPSCGREAARLSSATQVCQAPGKWSL